MFILKIKSLFIAILLSLLVTTTMASEGERLLDKFIVDTKTMTADFSQTLRSSDGEVLQQSSGQFYLNKPGKFRWNYSQPYAQEIVSDGKNIWIYDVDLEQVTVQEQSAVLSNSPMALIQDTISVNSVFDIKVLDESDGIFRLLLSTKSRATDFKNIILGVNEHGLQFMQMMDQFDQSTDIVFSNIKINHQIDPSVFNFKIPEGSDVFGGS